MINGRVLEHLPLHENSDDFVFDNQVLAQAVAFGLRIGEISYPAKYFAGKHLRLISLDR